MTRSASTRRRLLVVGAGRGQLGLITAARRLGITTIVATMPGHYPGIAAADEVLDVNIADPEAVLAASRAARLDGVATSCLDTGLPAVGHVAEELGLIGLSARSADLCADKVTMKEVLAAAGVSTPRHVELRSEADLDAAIEEIGFPLIVKASDLQGSKGVYQVDDWDSAYRAFTEAAALSPTGRCLVERFVTGEELGAQAMVKDGQVLFVLPHEDQTVTVDTTTIPVGHSVPYPGSDTLDENIRTIVIGAIRALGLDNCAVNVDLIRDGDEVFLIELTGRAGANGLVEMTSVWFGIDYYEAIVRLALGMDLPPSLNDGKGARRPAQSWMLQHHGPAGILQSYAIVAPEIQGVEEFRLFVDIGDEVRKFTNSNDCVGQVIISGLTREACHDRLAMFEPALKLDVAPANGYHP